MKILFEDNHILAVYKPASILVQSDITGDKSLLEICKEYIKKKYNKSGNVFLGLVHRIDRPAAGIVIFARTSKAASRLSEQFRNKRIKKFYNIIVEGILETKSMVIEDIITNEKGINQRAILKYNVINEKNNLSLIEIELITGRKHQIRKQFANIGHPVLGDLRYGDKNCLSDKSIALLAKKIIFEHPVNKNSITLEVDMPNNYPWKIFKFGISASSLANDTFITDEYPVLLPNIHEKK